MIILYLSLFVQFFLCGCFGYEGAYTLPAFYENMLISQHGWLTSDQFADILYVSRLLPDNLGINSAVMGGYLATATQYSTGFSFLGGFIALFGLTLPSFIWTKVANYYRHRFRNVGEVVISWLRPLAPGIVAAAILLLCTEENFGSITTSPWHFGISLFLFISTLIGTRVYRINPLFMVFLCGFAGLLLF